MLPDNIRRTALARIHSCSINSRHGLIRFKVIHRFHYSKARLHTFYSLVSPLCDKCKSKDGTLLHLFWGCPFIKSFWSSVFSFLGEGFNRRTFSPDRNLALFGCSEHSVTHPSHIQPVLLMGMVLAKKVIPKDWKTSTPSCFKNWIHGLFRLFIWRNCGSIMSKVNINGKHPGVLC